MSKLVTYFRGIKFTSIDEGYFECHHSNRGFFDGTTLLHRAKWQIRFGAIPKDHDIHHKNEIRIDNRYKNFLNSNQKSQVIISGVNIDKIYTKIDLNFARSSNSFSTDSLTSGKYIIIKYSDKILKNSFFSKVTLQRSDYKSRKE